MKLFLLLCTATAVSFAQQHNFDSAMSSRGLQFRFSDVKLWRVPLSDGIKKCTFTAEVESMNEASLRAIVFAVKIRLSNGTEYPFKVAPQDFGPRAKNTVRLMWEDNRYDPERAVGWSATVDSGQVASLVERQFYNGVISQDLGCYKDYQRIAALEGIALRKGLMELLTTGCVKTTEKPAVVTRVMNRFVKGPDAKLTPVTFALLTNVDTMEQISGYVVPEKLYTQKIWDDWHELPKLNWPPEILTEL